MDMVKQHQDAAAAAAAALRSLGTHQRMFLCVCAGSDSAVVPAPGRARGSAARSEL